MGRYTYILCCTILQIKAGNVLKGIVRAMDAYNYLVRTQMIRADLISLSFNATVTLTRRAGERSEIMWLFYQYQ